MNCDAYRQSQTTLVPALMPLKQGLLSVLDLLPECGIKGATYRVYGSRVWQLIEFIDSRYVTANAPSCSQFKDVVLLYLHESYNSGRLAITSVYSMLSTFRVVARFLGQQLDGVEFSARDKQTHVVQRAYLTAEQERDLLVVAGREDKPRNLAMLLILLTTAIRVGECTNLVISDLTWDNGGLSIRVERNNRTVQERAGTELARALQTWLFTRTQTEIGRQSPYLFFGQDGKALSRTALDHAIRKLGWKSGVVISARVLRNTRLRNRGLRTEHAAAGELIGGGKDVRGSRECMVPALDAWSLPAEHCDLGH